jgi:ketosteroid isomerase-like protein
MLGAMAMWMRFAVTVLAAAGCFAQAVPKEIEAAEKAWVKAILERDGAALERVLADDLIYAHASGVLDTKRSYIDKIMSGRQKYASLTQHHMIAREAGGSVLTHCWTHVTGVNPAGPFDDKVMTMHVWVKGAGGWRLAAHQTTKVAEIPASR